MNATALMMQLLHRRCAVSMELPEVSSSSSLQGATQPDCQRAGKECSVVGHGRTPAALSVCLSVRTSSRHRVPPAR